MRGMDRAWIFPPSSGASSLRAGATVAHVIDDKKNPPRGAGTHRGGTTSETPERGAKGESVVPALLRSRADHERRRRTRRPRAARARPAAGAPRGRAVQPPPPLELPPTLMVRAAV